MTACFQSGWLLCLVLVLVGLVYCYHQNDNKYMEGFDATTAATTAAVPSSHSDSAYDHYNHYQQVSNPVVYYGPDGGTAKVIQTQNENTVVITHVNGATDIYYVHSTPVKMYYGPNGGSAKLVADPSTGKSAVQITAPDGHTIMYTVTNPSLTQSFDETLNQYVPEQQHRGAADYNTAYSGTNSMVEGLTNNTITGPNGTTMSTYNTSAYSNSLPPGIPKSMIPSGQEDLYILKTQVVPPVCPACPNIINQCDKDQNQDSGNCPPCPAPQRCPEPAFECKKVMNYKSLNPAYTPIPVMSDFSSFGM